MESSGWTSSWDYFSLLLTLIVTIVMQLSFFSIAALCKFDKVTDLAGTANFLVLSLITLFAHDARFTRQVVVTLLVCVWALRLGSFLFWRVIVRGKDERFDNMRDHFFAFLGFWIFQMVWVWTVSLPVTFLNSMGADVSLNARDYIGWLMWGFGFVLEAIADQSKYNFNNNPANKGKLLCSGVWSWSRHPNYFGEISMWLGIFLSCSSVFDANSSTAYVSVLSPIITFVFLMFMSGVPLAEDRYDERFGRDPLYVDWKKSTSPLIPMPQAAYKVLPHVVKRVFCCEFNRYSRVLKSREGNGNASLVNFQAQEGI